jgi:hypothetical protein
MPGNGDHRRQIAAGQCDFRNEIESQGCSISSWRTPKSLNCAISATSVKKDRAIIGSGARLLRCKERQVSSSVALCSRGCVRLVRRADRDIGRLGSLSWVCSIRAAAPSTASFAISSNFTDGCREPRRPRRCEPDALYRMGYCGHLDFVYDNFIGKKSLRLFLPELAAWQRTHDYPFEFLKVRAGAT